MNVTVDDLLFKRMGTSSRERVALLQGTLDMLVLHTLKPGPAHGHAIAKHIQHTSEDVLQVDHGSLYPALHRLVRQGLITSKWERMPDRNREAAANYVPARRATRVDPLVALRSD